MRPFDSKILLQSIFHTGQIQSDALYRQHKTMKNGRNMKSNSISKIFSTLELQELTLVLDLYRSKARLFSTYNQVCYAVPSMF